MSDAALPAIELERLRLHVVDEGECVRRGRREHG